MKDYHTFIKAILTAIAIALIAVAAACLQLPGKLMMRLKGSEMRRFQITEENLRLLGYMSRLGMERSGIWAKSLDELGKQLSVPPGGEIRITDGWKRHLMYLPYDSVVGYGEIVSLGRDGRPGGSGFDADMVFRFDGETTMPCR